MPQTTNYNLTKPVIDSIGWGEDVNTNFDTIDTQMKANADAASNKVPTTRTVNSKALSSDVILSTADVSDVADKRYCTDAQKTVLENTSGSNTGDQTLPVKATGIEADNGTDDAKFLTSKAVKDSHNIPSVIPGTSGNVLTSNGTDWTSTASSASVVFASQAEAEAGTNDTKSMNPLRTSQAITALQRAIASQAEAEAGTDNTKDMTPLRVSQEIAALAKLGTDANKSLDTVYQAATDGFIVGDATTNTSTGYIVVLSDAVNPPTTRVGAAYSSSSITIEVGLNTPIKKGHYYKITKAGSATVSPLFFRPWGQ